MEERIDHKAEFRQAQKELDKENLIKNPIPPKMDNGKIIF